MKGHQEREDQVIKNACIAFKIPKAWLKSKKRTALMCSIRTGIINLLAMELKLTPAQIAKKTGWNRSTVYMAISRHDDYIKYMPGYKHGMARFEVIPKPWRQWWQ